MKGNSASALAALVTFFFANSVNSQAAQSISTIAPECPLECQADSQCVRGSSDLSKFLSVANDVPFIKNADSDGFYCQCPQGRTGLLCEREYETCGDDDHFCFHGGKCVSGLKDVNGVGHYYCDCGDAEFDGKTYAGKFCEAEAVEVCGSAPEYGQVFCANGGMCRDNFIEFLGQPCICQEGFEGPHCEYKKGTAPGCDLDCQHGGHCRIGSKEYPPNRAYKEYWETHDDNRYCVCPPGYFGLKCEIQGRRCGEEHCFNGATCVSRDMGDGTTKEFCDCTTANDRGSSFAGLHCESESTSFCTSLPDHNGHQFCVNGGQCRMDSHLGCDCLEGFNGPICEFRDSTPNDTECNLKCQHNGVCRHGAKDVGFLKKFQSFSVDMPSLDLSVSQNFEHCVCPKGFVGLQCEHKVDVCPGGESICMNGASCVADDSEGRLKYNCDCDSIHTPFHKYTGEFCELRSTDLCTLSGSPGVGLNKDAFCVNGGQCSSYVGPDQRHPGCTCPQGFEGEHCQSLSAEKQDGDHGDHNDNQTNDDKSNDDGMSTAGIMLIVIFVIVVILGGSVRYLYAKWLSQRQEEEAKSITNLMARDDAPPMHMEGLEEFSERSRHSLSSHSSHVSSVYDEDGLFKVEEKNQDLVNVAII